MSSMDVTNQTKETLRLMFLENKRFDGRKVFDVRDFEISYNVSDKAEGSARIKMGKTDVVVGIKLSPGAPYPDSLDKGNLAVSGDLLPLASPRFEMGPPGFQGIEIPRLVDRVLRESGMIEFKKLVIEEGKKVWTLYVDLYPINDDGSLTDAATIACVAALYNAKMPVLDKEGNIDYEKEGKDKLPLNRDAIPLSFTFYKLGDSLILHPTREEEEACETKITFGVSEFNGELMVNSCQKGWEATLKKHEIDSMMDIIEKKYPEMRKKVAKHLK